MSLMPIRRSFPDDASRFLSHSLACSSSSSATCSDSHRDAIARARAAIDMRGNTLTLSLPDKNFLCIALRLPRQTSKVKPLDGSNPREGCARSRFRHHLSLPLAHLSRAGAVASMSARVSWPGPFPGEDNSHIQFAMARVRLAPLETSPTCRAPLWHSRTIRTVSRAALRTLPQIATPGNCRAQPPFARGRKRRSSPAYRSRR